MTTLQIENEIAQRIKKFADSEGMTINQYLKKITDELELFAGIQEVKSEKSIEISCTKDFLQKKKKVENLEATGQVMQSELDIVRGNYHSFDSAAEAQKWFETHEKN